MPELTPETYANLSVIAAAISISVIAITIVFGLFDLFSAFFSRPGDDD